MELVIEKSIMCVFVVIYRLQIILDSFNRKKLWILNFQLILKTFSIILVTNGIWYAQLGFSLINGSNGMDLTQECTVVRDVKQETHKWIWWYERWDNNMQPWASCFHSTGTIHVMWTPILFCIYFTIMPCCDWWTPILGFLSPGKCQLSVHCDRTFNFDQIKW